MKRHNHRRHNNTMTPKAWLHAGFTVLAVGGLGIAIYLGSGKPMPDQYGCYESIEQSNHFVLFDASEPRLNEQQARSARNHFDELFANLGFNQKLSVITTEGDQISSPPKARFHVCGSARSPEELEENDAASATAGYLKKQKQRLYDEVYAPQIKALLSPTPDESRRQTSQSPILEMIQGISQMQGFVPGSRLTVLSDLLQNSESAQFCTKRNNMPPFRIFRKQEIYKQRLAPHSFEGVDVAILLLQRSGYGRGVYKYCKNEEELTRFWRDYFIGNGAASPKFIRIRNGYTAG